jgi:transcriptional regulator with PAS, ATPase and Fis domain
VHHESERRGRPFYAVNVAALPESILEAELFGYEKGAFTGAEGRKIGLFEQASGSTCSSTRWATSSATCR